MDAQVLIDRLRAGDKDALGTLFDVYRPRLRRMLQAHMDRRLKSRVNPSDILQEAYLDLAKGIESYLRGEQVAVYVWMRKIAWQRLLKAHARHLRAERRSVARECEPPRQSSLQLAHQILAQGSSPSQHLEQAELQQAVRRAIAGLKPQDREIISLRNFEGLTNGEAAQVLEIQDSTATMRYGRALFRLKELLLEMLDSFE